MIWNQFLANICIWNRQWATSNGKYTIWIHFLFIGNNFKLLRFGRATYIIQKKTFQMQRSVRFMYHPTLPRISSHFTPGTGHDLDGFGKTLLTALFSLSQIHKRYFMKTHQDLWRRIFTFLRYYSPDLLAENGLTITLPRTPLLDVVVTKLQENVL